MAFLSDSSEWTFELLEQYDSAIGKIAANYQLDTYPVQMEIISSEQMMDVYSTVGMPLSYHHWSFGKQYANIEESYKKGYRNLAYEIVINSNPCIAYLLEENSMAMQATIIAHACYGHNSFFKSNYLFQTWTDAESIIDYLVFAKSYIAQCEERYGIDAVEELLDSCHALMSHGVDRYKRPPQLSIQEEKARQKAREAYLQSQINDLWRTIPTGQKVETKDGNLNRFPSEPQENLLYFIEKNAPLLKPWQREIIRICRKIAQYFYPQRQTKVMNEGWATFWHYTILQTLYDKHTVTESLMLEFLHNHTSLVLQPEFDSPYYTGINPYALGFAIFKDVRRICEAPTKEDYHFFPEIAGKDWLSTLDFSMRNFKDESFISQYLSPKVIRDFHFFSIFDDEGKKDLIVSAIHNDEGYKKIRNVIANQYNISNQEPNIQIHSVNISGDRSIKLQHYQYKNRPLDEATTLVIKHFRKLWGFDVYLESLDATEKITKTYQCAESSDQKLKSA